MMHIKINSLLQSEKEEKKNLEMRRQIAHKMCHVLGLSFMTKMSLIVADPDPELNYARIRSRVKVRLDLVPS